MVDINSCRFLPEPVGSVIPKFPTTDSSRSFRGKRGENLTLLCPAQGFPVPKYRYGLFYVFLIFFSRIWITDNSEERVPFRIWRFKISKNSFSLEPVAGVLPKFPTAYSSASFQGKSDESLTLLCPAQAFPAPAFRSVYN